MDDFFVDIRKKRNFAKQLLKNDISTNNQSS